MPIHQVQAGQPDGNIEEENNAPMKIPRDQAAGEWPQHGANQPRYGDETHGADQLGFGKSPYHGKPANRQHHGSAAALKNAERDQHVDIARQSA